MKQVRDFETEAEARAFIEGIEKAREGYLRADPPTLRDYRQQGPPWQVWIDDYRPKTPEPPEPMFEQVADVARTGRPKRIKFSLVDERGEAL